MKYFYLKSMGCKSNQFEGQIVVQKLVDAGYKEVKKLEDAGVSLGKKCLSNSAGILELDAAFDMVRAGIIIYVFTIC